MTDTKADEPKQSDVEPHSRKSAPPLSTSHSTIGDDVTAAESYLAHLLDEGSREGDSGAELALPSWYDEQLFKRGQNYLSKYRFVIFSGMLAGLIAVLAIPSILKVLVSTRQSSAAFSAYRRYLRTILHTVSWYKNPLDKNSKFWTSVGSVRKAHARSSKASSKCGAGQITQKDLALTQFGFMGFLTGGAHRIQLYDTEFLEATTHLWRVLGYLLGIKDEYNICGRNWAETKPRLELILHRVYSPALDNTTTEFDHMSRALLDGLWFVNSSLSYGAQMYFTKRLAYCKGYEYYDFDYTNGRVPDPDQHNYYYDLGWWDRFIVSYGLFLVTFMHKYTIVRWYLNLRVIIMEFFMQYLPYLAIWQWGIKRSYVRIFTSGGQPQEFEFHMKEE